MVQPCPQVYKCYIVLEQPLSGGNMYDDQKAACRIHLPGKMLPQRLLRRKYSNDPGFEMFSFGVKIGVYNVKK